ncbi:MAG TPA: oligosaccharide flippase family protein [Anaerolineae bacterium]
MDLNENKNSAIRRSIMRGTISNYLGQLIILGTGFVLTPFILRRVGPVDYGLWVLLNSIIGYGFLLELGISGAIVKYTAEYRAKGASDEANRLIATALTTYTLLGLVALIITFVLAPLAPRIFNVPPESQLKAITLVRVAGIGLAVSIPATAPSAVLRGLQRFDLINVIAVFNAVASAIVIVAALLLGWGILGMVGLGIGVTILTAVPGVLLIRRTAPDIHLGWRGAKLELMRTVASFSVALFVIQFAGRLQTKTDEIVIGTFLPVSNVTPYSLARRLGEMANLLAYQFVKVLMPVASELHAAEDWPRLRSMYTAGTRLGLAASLAIAVTVSILAAPLLTAWVGPAYAIYSPLVVIVAVASVAVMTQYPAGAIMQGIARHRFLAVTSIASGLINLALSIALVRPFGLIGVALGTLIPTLLETFGLVLPYAMRVLGVDFGRMASEAFLPALLPALPMAATLYALRVLLEPSSLPMLALIGAIGALVYVGGYLAMRASASERMVVRTSLDRTLVLLKTVLK